MTIEEVVLDEVGGLSEEERAVRGEERHVLDGEHAQAATALQKTQLTRPQMQQARHYQPGHVVTMREQRQTRQYVVDSVDTRQNTVSMHDQSTGESRTESASRIQERGRLYEPVQINLGVGDRVIFNENDRDHDIRNGDSGHVKSIDASGVHIMLDRKDNGEPVNVTIDRELGAAIDYGYARTVHKSQGLTEGNVIVAGEASKGATAEQGYVATSRERDRLDVVTDNTERLARNWQRVADRETARSAIAKASQTRNGAAREQARQQARKQSEQVHEPESKLEQNQEPDQGQQAESAADGAQTQNADKAVDQDNANDDNKEQQQAYQPESRLKKQRQQEQRNDHDQGFESGL